MENNLNYTWIVLSGLGAIGPFLIGLILLNVARRQFNVEPLRYIAYFLFSISIEIILADIRAQFFTNHSYFTSLSLIIGIVGRTQEIIMGIITITRLLQFFFKSSE